MIGVGDHVELESAISKNESETPHVALSSAEKGKRAGYEKISMVARFIQHRFLHYLPPDIASEDR